MTSSSSAHSGSDAPTVLVTGGTGFLASWCIHLLLKDGYTVRTTVRDLRREAEVRAAAGQNGNERLEVVPADLGADDGWADAVRGCRYVLHVASPFPAAEPRDPDEVIAPAVGGTRRVLHAALDADVSRIVVTSSSTAVEYSAGPEPRRYDESYWTDPASPRAWAYVRAKTLAEKAAWEAADGCGARPSLTAIAPSTMLGPLRSPHLSYSVQAVNRLLDGSMPGVPRIGFTFVDVRDIAALHLRALISPAAAGHRYLASARFLWLADVARILRDALGPDASRVPRRQLPDFVVRAIALVNPELRQVVARLGRRAELSTDAAESDLGWAPRPVEQTVLDCARSILEHRAPPGVAPVSAYRSWSPRRA